MVNKSLEYLLQRIHPDCTGLIVKQYKWGWSITITIPEYKAKEEGRL